MNTTAIKTVKISAKNASKIEAILADANGKSTAHTYATADKIIQLATLAENKVVDLLGSQKAAVGTVVFSKSGYPVANAYGNSRIGTVVTLKRHSTGWFLTNADRCVLFKEGGYEIKLRLTAEQDTQAIEVLRRQYAYPRVSVTETT
jgi:hypothetical protein